MEKQARDRIDAASKALAETAGIDVPVVPYEAKPDMRMLRHLETQAAFLEALVAGRANDIADVELGAEVAPDGDAVVVTEAVDGEVAKPKASRKR
jgi:hypothetical protein